MTCPIQNVIQTFWKHVSMSSGCCLTMRTICCSPLFHVFPAHFLMNNVTHEGKNTNREPRVINPPVKAKRSFFFPEFSLKSSFRVNSHHIRSPLQSTCHLLFVQALLKHKHTRTQPFLSLRLFHFLSLALHSGILLSNPILVNKMAGNIR